MLDWEIMVYILWRLDGVLRCGGMDEGNGKPGVHIMKLRSLRLVRSSTTVFKKP